jgi:hypothetical protein
MSTRPSACPSQHISPKRRAVEKNGKNQKYLFRMERTAELLI